MIDFMMIATRSTKRGVLEIYPKFIIKKSEDLMIRGGDFYAIWLEDRGLWSTDEQDALQLIDFELDQYLENHRHEFESNVKVLHMWDAESGMIDSWHKYCQKQMRDSFHMLDETLIFSNTKTKKKDYASKRLPYPLTDGETDAYDKLMSTLYSPEERLKLEWAIGSVVTGDSKKLQKFIVLYGAAGTGKSTVLNIIQQLFEGYYSVFDAKALGSANNSFALEAFKSNPLVAIQHDGDLSRIDDNTRLNSLVSHELMTVNEKFKSTYSNRFKCFLFMGTNKPVKITDAKSGLIRRLIDVSPTGNKIPAKEYKTLVKQIEFELGGIATKCKKIYLEDPGKYDNYIPLVMLGASNDFYNFIVDSYFTFEKEGGISLKQAWEMYRTYCDNAKVNYPFSQRVFKEEFKNYFNDYKDRYTLPDGTRVRSWYQGFKADIFEDYKKESEQPKPSTWLIFAEQKSLLDSELSECQAQYASKNETPARKWENVTTKLSDLDTTKLHYVKIPENHIVIDFDIPDENGEKSLSKNLEEASKFPPTYAELSKSGAGIHLHYIYTGDVSQLRRLFAEHVEIKVFTGNGSLRRKLTKCCSLPIRKIDSGLPLKGEKKRMVNSETIKSEKALRNIIIRNLKKEIHPATKPSIDFIYKILDDAYNSGLKYDVSDMENDIFIFASNSTNNSEYCMHLVPKMKFKSEEELDPGVESTDDLVFFDVEVFPNLFLVNWKVAGEGKPVSRMINPTPSEIEGLLKYKLVGFNCRRYDNHILYACLMGYSNDQLFNLSQKIISGAKNCFFGEAYNVSYTDVYDFSSKKQSLKKFEIELGIHHQELGLDWNEPVPEKMWLKVAEYCDNDVLATEAVFNARKSDFIARQILADVAGMTVNDTTNSLTTRIIFGTDRHPQDQFNYRDMGDVEPLEKYARYSDAAGSHPDEHNVFNIRKQPVFPGYIFDRGKSTYRGEEVGEGGYVYANPGMYGNVALLDIASMHPSSIVAENLFGNTYTKRFQEILNARIAIKHKDFSKAKKMLGGTLAKYLTDEEAADSLAQALKIAINSVYGLTSATFDNPFKDPRNKDNIVAKRGALFMINLKHAVEARGFIVAHIKTDSIKIPNATPEIIKFVTDFGLEYGYTFEHEATYDRMCLVNDAVYIAKYATVEQCRELYGTNYVDFLKDVLKDCKKHGGEWTATGTQFQVPYVFKTLFSHEPVIFRDLCETKSVTSSIYLDMNEDLEDVTIYEKELDKIRKNKDSDEDDKQIEELLKKIEAGHNYIFVGRVGLFCPVKDGTGGGILLRETLDKQGNKKYDAVVGTKGYRWKEAEIVQSLGLQDDIDLSYYDNLVDNAIKAINDHGDYTWFASDKPYYDEAGDSPALPF